ncbi:hypothetical protein RMATCC62417_14103 [Rhizopus microsporus]|nr:hypothetical protein RMATCC62417_14103 [Rhizopus microsporus]
MNLSSKDLKQDLIEKPKEYVPIDPLIEEKEIIQETYVPDEKEPDPTILENNAREKSVPDTIMVSDEVIPSKIELLEKERTCEEKIAEELDKKAIDPQSISSASQFQKPEEKTIEREPEKKKGILRKAVLENYRNASEDKEKILVEQQTNALPSPSSSLRSLHILPDRSMISIKDVYASPVRTDPGILSRQSSRKDNMSDTASISIKSLSTRSFLNEQPMQPSSRPVTQSRRGSISSKKSSQSIKSARRHNEKKASQAAQKYIPRTYEEMMRIPDIYERIVFYEKTLDLCLRTESPITHWSQFMSTRGKPKALEEASKPNTCTLHKLVYPTQDGEQFKFEQVKKYQDEDYHSNSWLVKIASNGRYLLAPTIYGQIFVFNMLSGQVTAILKDHQDMEVRDVIFHPYRPLLFSCGDDGCVKVYTYSENDTGKVDVEQDLDVGMIEIEEQ